MQGANCFAAVVLLTAAVAGTCAAAPFHGPASWADITALPRPAAGQRIAYGSGPKQFGELRLPRGRGPYPVAVLLHGGCWSADYHSDYLAPLSDRLAHAGIATWNIEYRGVGDAGGGWPGTFDDVARGAAQLRTLASTYPLDLHNVVLVGHSAGGQLALWLAARHPAVHSISAGAPLAVRGVVTLAGIVDLRDYAARPGECSQAVEPLMGGPAATRPDRYAAASPSELLPIGVPMRLLLGSVDPIVPRAHNARFAAQARRSGDDAQLTMIEGAGHFDLVLPRGPGFERVQRAIQSLLRLPARKPKSS